MLATIIYRYKKLKINDERTEDSFKPPLDERDPVFDNCDD